MCCMYLKNKSQEEDAYGPAHNLGLNLTLLAFYAAINN